MTRRRAEFDDAELEEMPADLRWREYMGRIEAVLFAAPEPVTREALARVVGEKVVIEALIDDINAELRARPYEIVFVAGGWRFQSRAKFAPFLRPVDVKNFLAQVWELALHIPDPPAIRACRDPKDDKFLEVATHGRADAIITGDQDLLTLNPFRGIAILTPAEYLAHK